MSDAATRARVARRFGHDLRNPLASISVNIGFVDESLRGAPEVDAALDRVQSALREMLAEIERYESSSGVVSHDGAPGR